MSTHDMSDDAFMAWCESFKPCSFCSQKFYGPVCPCERERLGYPETTGTQKCRDR